MASQRGDMSSNQEPEKGRGIFRYWSLTTSSQPLPDGGLIAWLQLLSSFLINFNNFSLANSFGVFPTYYETILL